MITTVSCNRCFYLFWIKKYGSILLLVLFFQPLFAQTTDSSKWWHNKERELRYHPEGNDIVITNGKRRFTRALYGTNTAFRVEAGDLPEFAIYMPGMGGNIKFGLVNGDSCKWLIKVEKITARYRAGSMLYEIEDAMLGKGKMYLTILAMADTEGMIIRVVAKDISADVKLVWVYGGASGKKFNRDGDMGPDPESSFYLKPENCVDNNYSLYGNSFLLKYGTGVVAEWDPYVNKNFATDTVAAVKIGTEQRMAGIAPPSSGIHIANAAEQFSPLLLYQSGKSKTPVVTGTFNVSSNEPYFFAFQKPGDEKIISYEMMPALFDLAEGARKKIRFIAAYIKSSGYYRCFTFS